MKNIITFTITGFAFLLLTTTVSAATIVETKIERVYTATPTHMEVTEKKTSTILQRGYQITAGQPEMFVLQNFIDEGTTKEAEKIKSIRDSMTLINDSGKIVKPGIEEKDGNLYVRTNFTKTIKRNQSSTFTLTYKAPDLVNRVGNLYDIYLIPFSKDFSFSSQSERQVYSTKLRIPVSMGPINFAIPEVEFKEVNGYYEADIATSQLIGKFGWVQLGLEQFYEFSVTQPIRATSENPFIYNTYEVTIPRDYKNLIIDQSVWFKELSPQPLHMRQDANNNLIAVYELPANQSHNIKITGFAKLSQKKDMIFDGGKLQEINKELMKTDLASAEYWEVYHQEIKLKAENLQAGETDIYRLAAKTYSDIVNTIDYAKVDRFGLSTRKGALATLRGESEAVCMEYSDLFITLMRAMNIPARAAYGHGYDSRIPVDEQVGHQWAEVYLPRHDGWIGVDVTWGESGQTLIGGDLNHFYTHIANTNPNDPPQVRTSYFGPNPITESYGLNVQALQKLPDVTGLMQVQDLLTQYPKPEVNQLRTIARTLQVLDGEITSFITRLLAGNRDIALVIRTGLYVAPVLLITLIVVRLTRRNKRHLHQPATN